MTAIDLDALAAEQSEFDPAQKLSGRSSREERLIAGFEDVQRFVADRGRVPQQGEERDIFERLYAVRLEHLCHLAECRALLEPLDHQGLRRPAIPPAAAADPALHSELLASALARLDIEIKDRFGNPVVPREWFLLPLHVIDEAVAKIRDGSITRYRYDLASAGLVEREG